MILPIIFMIDFCPTPCNIASRVKILVDFHTVHCQHKGFPLANPGWAARPCPEKTIFKLPFDTAISCSAPNGLECHCQSCLDLDSSEFEARRIFFPLHVTSWTQEIGCEQLPIVRRETAIFGVFEAWIGSWPTWEWTITLMAEQYFFILSKSLSSCFFPVSSCHFLLYLVKAFFLLLYLKHREAPFRHQRRQCR